MDDVAELEDDAAETLKLERSDMEPIPGESVAAILLMLLEEMDAAAILKHFEPDEVKLIAKAMFDSAQVNEAQVELALDRFVLTSRSVSALAVGADARIRTVMNEALGNVRADNILSAVAPQSSAAALDMLRWMELPTISHILQTEHPQVGAIILSVLTPAAAAGALESLDDNLQGDLVYRAAKLSTVRRDAIQDLELVLQNASSVAETMPGMRFGGSTDVAKIVNQLPKPAMEKVLRSLKKKDRILGQAVEDEMFVFENLNELDAKTLATILRAVDAKDLALALKGADGSLTNKFLATMSQRAAETIRDEMADMGPAKRADVEEAQKSILVVARRLADEGSIMLGGQGDDYV